MARYLMLALNGPTAGPGDEDAYNHWFDTIHLPDLKAIEGVRSARRYKVIRGNLPGMEAWPYLAAYEIEVDDLSELSRRMAAGMRPYHPAFDRSRSAHLMAVQISGDDMEVVPPGWQPASP